MTIQEIFLAHDAISLIIVFLMVILTLADTKRARMYVVTFGIIEVLIQLNDIMKLAAL